MIVAACVLTFILLVSLAIIHRLGEFHHGYIGAVLLVAALLLDAPVVFMWLGIALLADDDVQHVAEAVGLVPRMADFTPIHKLGAWLLGKVA